MAERPDLEYVVPILDRELRGMTINGGHADKPVVLRMTLPQGLETLLPGEVIRGVTRRGHFVVIHLEGQYALDIVISPMLAGRFVLAAGQTRAPADLAFTLVLTSGLELRYRDDVQMGKVYLISKGDYAKVPGLLNIGIDVLDKKVFTCKAFRALAKQRRDQVKVFLMDKSALDAMGNAYADEVLFEAGIHPKAFVRGLSEIELDRLHDAIVRVLMDAKRVIGERKPPLDQKLRDFLKIRGRAGEACTRCGDKIRRTGVHGHDAFFCPTCQPDARETSLVTWRKKKE